MRFTRDKKALYRHFEKDPILYGYHIGDLDDFYFGDCQWAVLGDGDIEEVVLIYTGNEVPTVQAFGTGGNFNGFLEKILPDLPDAFYCHFQNDSREIFERAFKNKSLGTHLKMKLASDSYKSHIKDNPQIRRLRMKDSQKLRHLYQLSYPGNYFNDRMLETGKYFGCVINDDIVCVSGVHVHSAEYKISVLGNITTHPDFRGRGLATTVTARLISELRKNGSLIALNVKNNNFAAIKCYKNLGFEIYCQYEESFFSRNREEIH